MQCQSQSQHENQNQNQSQRNALGAKEIGASERASGGTTRSCQLI